MQKTIRLITQSPLNHLRSNKITEERAYVLKQLRAAGFEVKESKKTPENGVYSGVVGKLDKVIRIDI